MKHAIFHNKVKEQFHLFPVEIKKALGQAILDLQKGHKLSMPLSRPMPIVSMGVEELRVKDKSGIYRAFYYTKSEKGILIFHAFNKKSQQTPDHEIELARKRLKEMLYE